MEVQQIIPGWVTWKDFMKETYLETEEKKKKLKKCCTCVRERTFYRVAKMPGKPGKYTLKAFIYITWHYILNSVTLHTMFNTLSLISNVHSFLLCHRKLQWGSVFPSVLACASASCISLLNKCGPTTLLCGRNQDASFKSDKPTYHSMWPHHPIQLWKLSSRVPHYWKY